jgi:predicted amidohydrolase
MIRIAIIQFAPILGYLDKTIGKLKLLFTKVQGADLIVLPELANSGYNFISKEQAFALAEDPRSSPFLDFLVAMSRRFRAHIVTGFNEKAGSRIFNTALLLGPDGIAGKYRKIHLFLNEKDYFTRGDRGLPVFDLGEYKLGMLICFDWIFPEVWRILALKGADIICHPSNLVMPYAQKVVPGYAVVNRIFTVTANRTGTERDVNFTGRSFIAGPSGKVIKRATATEEEVIVARVDPLQARNKMVTPRNDVFADRFPEEYREII